MHGVFGFGLPEASRAAAARLRNSTSTSRLAPVNRLHCLIRLFELLLDVVTTYLLKRTFGLLELRALSFALIGPPPHSLIGLGAIRFGNLRLGHRQLLELGHHRVKGLLCHGKIISVDERLACLDFTREPVAVPLRLRDLSPVLVAFRLGVTESCLGLLCGRSGPLDLVAGPGLQCFELRRQVPGLSIQRVEL